MKLQKRPYIIVPKLIEQPTWVGDYILKMKGWSGKTYLKNRKIGQSYELFSQSKLLLKIRNTDNERFVAELGTANSDSVLNKLPYKKNVDYVNIPDVTKHAKHTLLIKINQATGNSFQLHIPPSKKNPRWKPKAESWYYFENGLITLGLKNGAELSFYKDVCKKIEQKMLELSQLIRKKALSVESARIEASAFIKILNPWRFVNKYTVKKGSVIDPSLGGIHHSWEEDRHRYPLGNVLYEIQEDVMDPVSTIRAFDQGKMDNMGNVREIHIDDYFKYLDSSSEHNNIKNMLRKREGNRLLSTKYYRLDLVDVNGKIVDKTVQSFVHLFVQEGEVNIAAKDGSVVLGKGHSCFVPLETGGYTITSNEPATLLKTFIE